MGLKCLCVAYFDACFSAMVLYSGLLKLFQKHVRLFSGLADQGIRAGAWASQEQGCLTLSFNPSFEALLKHARQNDFKPVNTRVNGIVS